MIIIAGVWVCEAVSIELSTMLVLFFSRPCTFFLRPHKTPSVSAQSFSNLYSYLHFPSMVIHPAQTFHDLHDRRLRSALFITQDAIIVQQLQNICLPLMVWSVSHTVAKILSRIVKVWGVYINNDKMHKVTECLGLLLCHIK